MQHMRKLLLFIVLPILILAIIFFSGPRPKRPAFSNVMPEVPATPEGLENYIHTNESRHKLKPDNEARIIWNDSSKTKTEYAVVYLHGFSASQKEGDPVHLRFAKEFGCNLYLARMADHGVDTTESLLYYTADRAWASAKEAVAIGKQLGNKVILISTSTGGTLALMLAARFPNDVYALINLSPNIAINNPAAFLLNGPWGLQIARMVMKGKYNVTTTSDSRLNYWNRRYRLEALVQLEELLEDEMTTETFSKVTQPTLTLCYYKNEQEQDPEVKVSAMYEMNKALGTPEEKKEVVAIPKAGAHVLGSSLVSKDVEGVYAAIEKFAITKLNLKKVQE